MRSLTKMKSGVILVRNPTLGKKLVSWEMMCLMKTWRLRKQATQSWMSSLFMSKMTFLIPYLVEHLDAEGHMGGAGFLNVGGWTQTFGDFPRHRQPCRGGAHGYRGGGGGHSRGSYYGGRSYGNMGMGGPLGNAYPHRGYGRD